MTEVVEAVEAVIIIVTLYLIVSLIARDGRNRN